MKTLVLIILGAMLLLLMASFLLLSSGPSEVSDGSVVTAMAQGLTATSESGVTTVSAGAVQSPPSDLVSQSHEITVAPTRQAVGAQAVYAAATATQESEVIAQAATQEVVQAQRVIEAQHLEQLKATPVHAQAMETQESAGASNQALATSRSVQIAAAKTYEAFAPTATVQAALVATAQVKAFAQATSTVKAAKAELTAIEAQVAQAEKSLDQIRSMGLATDGVSATLEALEAQARAKVSALENTQVQGWMPSGGGGYASVGSATYMVQPGDTWYSISVRYGVSVNVLAAANGMSVHQSLHVGLVLVIPHPGPVPGPGPGVVYMVQPRDTMYSISRRFGVPLEELATLNGIVNINRIWVGQNLIIPVPGPYPPGPPGPWVPTPVWPVVPTVWPPAPTPWPWTPTPITPTGNDVYYSTDGRFSVQYPRAWQWGTDVPLGYVMFWTRETSDPFSVGFAIFSKPSSVWRPAREVLDDYKDDLSSRGLMNSLWAGATFTWGGDVKPHTLGGQLSMGQMGNAQSNRVLARATSRDDGSREYMALTWAPSNEWDAAQATLEALINTLAFTN